jgi:4-aminobutyrate aminotransferase-like enzyme
MAGVELSVDAGRVGELALERGLIVNSIAGRVLRLLPPLIVGKPEIDEAVEIIDYAIGEVEA